MKKRIIVNPRGRHRKNGVGRAGRNKARLISMRKDVAAHAIRSNVLFCDLGRDDGYKRKCVWLNETRDGALSAKTR